jgi:hypothetical protein
MHSDSNGRTASAQGSPKLNRGVLFRNDRKVSDRDADYTGHINVNGQEFCYLSISVKPKTDQAKAKPTGAAPRFGDVPFLPERRG